VTDFQTIDLLAILPEIALTALGVLVLVLDVTWRGKIRQQLGVVTAVGLFAIAVLTAVFTYPAESHLLYGGMIRHDLLAFVMRLIFLVSAAFTALLSVDVDNLGRRGEYYAVLIAAVIGMNLMAASADLIMLYLALETTSISAYILAGFLFNEERSAEAGMKYFLFGAVTSTVMLFGFSLLFGFAGTTNLYQIGTTIQASSLAITVIAVLVLVGIGFKLAVFPFHFWSPDVYEGAPTPVTAFISTASKAAGFAVLLRVFLIAFDGTNLQSASNWLPLLTSIAVVTTSLGNLVALAQKNIKRLLAYSSIAHAGYTLMAFTAIQSTSVQSEAVAAVVYYLVTYVLTNLTAFGVIILVAKNVGSDDVAAFAGLNKRNAGLSLAMLVAFLSLAGIPPLAGFVGKFFIFMALVKANLLWLAIVLAVNSLIALYYYLLVLNVVYNRPVAEGATEIQVSAPYRVALTALCIGVVVVGVVIAPFYDPITRIFDLVK
jgi:NADH-quinone oxidoreductase subunit N